MKKGMRESAAVEMVPIKSYTSSGVRVFQRYLFIPLRKGTSSLVLTPLRSILLSEITCLAIAGLRIEGLTHEFSKALNLQEDILDVILNVKHIILKGALSKPVVAKLTYRGPGIITALDIKLPNGVNILDSAQYIATATTNKIIKMEFLIKSGKGYYLNHDNTSKYDLKGFIKIDAIYMPVTRFNFFVETFTSDEPFPAFENLILEISTNGSVTPEDAIRQAFKKFKKRFFGFETRVLEILHPPDGPILKKVPTSTRKRKRRKKKRNSRKIINKLALISVEQLKLSVRPNRILHKHNINTLSKLVVYSQKDLLALKGVGLKVVNEIELKLLRLVKSCSNRKVKHLIMSSDLAQTLNSFRK